MTGARDSCRRILGAGLSGLAAAITLARAGERVVVHERRDGVGRQSAPNYQGLLAAEGDAEGYLRRWGFAPRHEQRSVTRLLCCTQRRAFNLTLAEPMELVLRGGTGSLEAGLAAEAEALGVEFRFRSRPAPRRGDIIATGTCHTDMVAFGAYYENRDFPRDTFLYMHDERYSPRGWYLYLIPMGDDRVKVVNCCSQPHTRRVRELLFRAVRERKVLRDILGDAKPVATMGGVGGADPPRSAVRDGTLYTGEAAGFQDPWRGFGMGYAIESGVLAARALLDGGDYDAAWRAQFRERLRADIARRGIFWLFGNRAFEHAMRPFRDGDTVSWDDINPSGWRKALLYGLFYRLAMARKKIIGYW